MDLEREKAAVVKLEKTMRKSKIEQGCIGCLQEKRSEKILNIHSIMANLNLGQDVAN